MATTMDFNNWIDNLAEKEIEDIYNLYESISLTTDMGGFKTTQNNNGDKFVQSDFNEDTLRLVHQHAETAFLNILDYKFGGEFGSVSGHYEFLRSMNKND